MNLQGTDDILPTTTYEALGMSFALSGPQILYLLKGECKLDDLQNQSLLIVFLKFYEVESKLSISVIKMLLSVKKKRTNE